MFPFMRNESGFTVIVNSKSFSVPNSHKHYGELVQAVKNEDADTFLAKVSIEEAVTSYLANSSLAGKATIVDGEVHYEGKPVHSTLADRITEIAELELPVDNWLRFMEKLFQNPSRRAIEELFDFLSHKNLPITADGNFLAYKTVDANFWSKRGGSTVLTKGKVDEQGKIFNGVGEEIECARNQVDDNRDHECSNGLHIGSLKYSGPNGTYNKVGDKVIIVEVNPADVIAVPKDYSAQKARVCHYIVRAEYELPLPSTVENADSYARPTQYSSSYDDFDNYWADSLEDEEEEYEDDTYGDDNDGQSVTSAEVRGGDEVEFIYKDKVRYLDVGPDTTQDFVRGELLEDDPSHSYEKNNFRTFTRSLMTDCVVLN